MNYLYILEITLLSIASSANIFSRSIGYLFLFMVSFAVQKLLSLVAAAAAKLLQLCPTLCDAIDSSPPGSSIRGIFQARVLEWVPSPSPLSVVRSCLFSLLFLLPWETDLRKHCYNLCQRMFCLYSRSFMVSYLVFKSLSLFLCMM